MLRGLYPEIPTIVISGAPGSPLAKLADIALFTAPAPEVVAAVADMPLKALWWLIQRRWNRLIPFSRVEATVATGCGTVVVEGTARQAKLKNVGTGKLDASRRGVYSNQRHTFNRTFVGRGLDGEVILVVVEHYAGRRFGNTREVNPSLDCHISEKLTVYGVGPGKVRMHIKPEKLTNRSMCFVRQCKNTNKSRAKQLF